MRAWNAKHPETVRLNNERKNLIRAALTGAERAAYLLAKRDREAARLAVLRASIGWKSRAQKARKNNPEYLREWRKKNALVLKASRVTKKYKISLSEYEAVVAQDCQICGKTPAQVVMQCDHDHETGLVRGALCGPCNRVLGNAHDKPEVLEGALAYLKKHSQQPTPQYL